jgi:hypothetical protein
MGNVCGEIMTMMDWPLTMTGDRTSSQNDSGSLTDVS